MTDKELNYSHKGRRLRNWVIVAERAGLAIAFLAAIFALWVYFIFYPIAVVDQLFEPARGLPATWGEWAPIEQLPNYEELDLRNIRGEKPIAFRKGLYQTPLHEFDIIETKSASGAASYNPTLIKSHKRLTPFILCNIAVLAIFSGLAAAHFRLRRRT